mmetsp:Transcript_26408/g.76178  ORF Transcript_26408/g.76178 Transcript_26408/m.76178 type:complete len:200 (+) Transcript_26408:800-1399(+)
MIAGLAARSLRGAMGRSASGQIAAAMPHRGHRRIRQRSLLGHHPFPRACCPRRIGRRLHQRCRQAPRVPAAAAPAQTPPRRPGLTAVWREPHPPTPAEVPLPRMADASRRATGHCHHPAADARGAIARRASGAKAREMPSRLAGTKAREMPSRSACATAARGCWGQVYLPSRANPAAKGRAQCRRPRGRRRHAALHGLR